MRLNDFVFSFAQEMNQIRIQNRNQLRQIFPFLAVWIDKGAQAEALFLSRIIELQETMLSVPLDLKYFFNSGVRPLLERPKKQVNRFDILSENIQLHIFSYLDLKSLKQSQKVCKSWNKVINKAQFTPTSPLFFIWETHETAFHLLSLLPKVKDLKSSLVRRTSNFKIESGLLTITKVALLSLSFHTMLLHHLRTELGIMVSPSDLLGVNGVFTTLSACFCTMLARKNYLKKVDKLKSSINRQIDFCFLSKRLLKDPFLKQYKCPISQRVMLLPVEDQNHNLYDYLSIASTPGETTFKHPLTGQDVSYKNLKFRVDIFFAIQQRLQELCKMDEKIKNRTQYQLFHRKQPILPSQHLDNV